MMGCWDSSRRSGSAAVASATPRVVDCDAGSAGTTSHNASPYLSLSRCERSRQCPIGWSSRTLISFSLIASDTSRWAVWRDTPSLLAISSWVLPAM